MIDFESERVERLYNAAKVALSLSDTPCRPDHHGLCQEHGLDPVEYCWVPRLRSAIQEFAFGLTQAQLNIRQQQAFGECRACSNPATVQLRLPAGTVASMCVDHASVLIERGWDGGAVTVLSEVTP